MRGGKRLECELRSREWRRRGARKKRTGKERVGGEKRTTTTHATFEPDELVDLTEEDEKR